MRSGTKNDIHLNVSDFYHQGGNAAACILWEGGSPLTGFYFGGYI